MNKLIFSSIILGVVVLFLTSCSSGPGKYDALAQCLTAHNATMFGAYWCPHCQAQKKDFGSSFKYVNYVECALPGGSGQTEYCAKEKIEKYPTWAFADGSRTTGELTFQELSTRSGCVLTS